MSDITPDAPTTHREGLAAPAEQTGWWVYIKRQYTADLAVGPYATKEIVDAAFESSLLIDGFCEEDCLDAWTADEQPDDAWERVYIDPADPDHFSRR